MVFACVLQHLKNTLGKGVSCRWILDNSCSFLTSSLVAVVVQVPHPVPSKDACFSPPKFWSVQLDAVCLFAGCLSFQDPRAATKGCYKWSQEMNGWAKCATNIQNMSLISVQHPRIEAGSRCHCLYIQGMRHHCLFGAQSMAARRRSNLKKVSPLSRSAAKAGLGSVETSISSNLSSMISWISDDFYWKSRHWPGKSGNLSACNLPCEQACVVLSPILQLSCSGCGIGPVIAMISVVLSDLFGTKAVIE